MNRKFDYQQVMPQDLSTVGAAGGPRFVRSVFVISDLHLGGIYPVPPDPKKRGFRLCTHADAIVKFVVQRTRDAKQGATEIVLNGDTVDFLAEVDIPGGKPATWLSFTA